MPSINFLISFIGGTHGLPANEPLIKPFLVAFFGLYLQGHDDYAQYLTEDYVNSIEGLHWGAYPPE
jgi:hypothetical protein